MMYQYQTPEYRQMIRNDFRIIAGAIAKLDGALNNEPQLLGWKDTSLTSQIVEMAVEYVTAIASDALTRTGSLSGRYKIGSLRARVYAL